MQKCLIQYVRNGERAPYATFTARLNDQGRPVFGWSKYAKDKEDAPFSKKVGKSLAMKNSYHTNVFIFNPRLNLNMNRKNDEAEYSCITGDLYTKYNFFIPADLQRKAVKFLQRATKYFGIAPFNITELSYSDVSFRASLNSILECDEVEEEMIDEACADLSGCGCQECMQKCGEEKSE